MTNSELILQHDEDTKYCSLFGHMQQVSTTYKDIVDKGEEIIPDILRYLSHKECGMNIIMLLYVITGVSPYEPQTTKFGMVVAYNVSDAIKAWINWGKENKYI